MSTGLTPEREQEIRERAAHLHEYATSHGDGEGDTLAGEDVPALLAEVARLRDRGTELEAQALWLAEYDGVAPELHTTVEAAKAMCDDVAAVDAHGKGWDWLVDEDGVHVQVWTHPDSDRPTGRTSGTVTRLVVQGPETGVGQASSYPPALPWAALMDDEDLFETLGEIWNVVRPVADSATQLDARALLAELENVLGSCRAMAELQHAHNTAAGPDADEAGEVR